MEALISVILPVYKTDISLFKEAVLSVLNQTYKNFELIVVDNGSVEPTYKKYLISDSRIVYHHVKQGGVSNARNEGIKIAKGDYISFIDADDLYHPTYLENLYNISKLNDSDISICNYTMDQNIFSKTTLIDDNIVFKDSEVLTKLLSYYLDPRKTQPNWPLLHFIWNMLIKRDLANKIKFNTNFIVLEDLDYLIKLLLSSTTVSVTHNILYFYRDVETSISRKKNYKFLNNEYNSLSQIYQRYIESFKGQMKNEFSGAMFKFSLNDMVLAKKMKNKMFIKKFKLLCIEISKNIVISKLNKRRKILFILFKLKLYFLVYYFYSQKRT